MIISRRFLALAWSVAAVAIASSVAAQSIVLHAKTGDVEIKGTLVEFDGEFYNIETELGVLTVDGRTVTCTGEACPTAEMLVSRFELAGPDQISGTLLPLLVEAFAVSLEGDVETSSGKDGRVLSVRDSSGTQVAEITLATLQETASFAALAKNESMIIATGRTPTTAELAVVRKAGLGDLAAADQHQVLALDGIVAVVSDNNPLSTVSLGDLGKILRGKITNWRDIGGPDVPINLYLPADAQGFYAAAKASPLGLSRAEIADTAIIKGSLADVADAASFDPFGLALTNYSNIRNARALGLRGSCDIYSYPSVFSLKTGGYPLAYNHYLYFSNAGLPVFAREFLSFVRSEQAQNMISVLGFADLGISSQPLNRQGLRLANAIEHVGDLVPLDDLKSMVAMMRGAERLSTTFRFESGSRSLDRQSLQNADLLAADLLLGNYADKQVYIVGFSAAIGGQSRNKDRSRKMALAVHRALVETAPKGSLDEVRFHVAGFGSASPMACQDTLAGKKANQRVEIWIKDQE